MANRHAAPVAKVELPRDAANLFDDILAEIDRGKSIGEIGKGWRLERNSDGRLRWRWQVKDRAGQPVTYQKPDGTTGYARGSRYVGITQIAEAERHDRERLRGKRRRRRAAGR